jgi:hypothetical protein
MLIVPTDLNQGPGSSSRSRRAPLWFRGMPRLIPITVILGDNCTDQDAVRILRTPLTGTLFDWETTGFYA